MTVSSIILIIIAVTGIVLIHEHDTTFFSRTRVPTAILPDKYQDKLDAMREAQGIDDQFSSDDKSVPLSWLMYDLHSGEFFGRWAWLYYDLLSAALVVYSVTGIYMFYKLTQRKGKQSKKILKEKA